MKCIIQHTTYNIQHTTYNIIENNMSITRDQIYQIANSLHADGIKPTLAAVRRRLGSGSFTTISEALNEWKIMQASATDDKISERLPDALRERVQLFSTTLWREAINIASRRFAKASYVGDLVI